MTFGQPLFLLGALAALIPLAIHLFDRRRPKEVPFAALDFVLRSQRRTASRLKLKRLLLYALRTLFLLAIPLALARPSCAEQTAAVSARGLAATTIVLEASLATRYAEGTSLFEAGKKAARAALQDLAAEEPATVVICGPTPTLVAPVGFDRVVLQRELDAARPSFERSDLNGCLELATRALDDSPLPNRRVVLVSALTLNALSLEAPPPVARTAKGELVKPELVVVDVAEGKALPNRALVDVRAEAAPQLGARAWQFTFTVKNFSSEALTSVELRLEVDGQAVQKGFVDLAPEGTTQKTLAYRFPTGGVATVTGRLQADALSDDDARSVVVVVPDELTALIVDGAPFPQKYRDEAFFTEAALSAPGSPVRATLRDADAAWKEPLERYDVIFLLNVEPPPQEVVDALTRHVTNGGGLFISMGDRVDPDAWNASLGALLPRRLRVVKTSVEPTAPDAATRAARLTQVAVNHPIMTPFVGRAREGLLSARFYRYALFEGEDQGHQAEVLGSMDDGAPVFLSARVGSGRVLLYASTVDRDWSDLAIRTSFLPLMQRVAGWLAGALDEREEVTARVGSMVTLQPEAGQAPSAAKSPSNVTVALIGQPERNTVTGGPLPEPGPYTVQSADGSQLPTLAFAASIDPEASDLSRHSLEALRQWFGQEALKTSEATGRDRSTPLWTWLIFAAVLAFFFEGVLLRR